MEHPIGMDDLGVPLFSETPNTWFKKIETSCCSDWCFWTILNHWCTKYAWAILTCVLCVSRTDSKTHGFFVRSHHRFPNFRSDPSGKWNPIWRTYIFQLGLVQPPNLGFLKSSWNDVEGPLKTLQQKLWNPHGNHQTEHDSTPRTSRHSFQTKTWEVWEVSRREARHNRVRF